MPDKKDTDLTKPNHSPTPSPRHHQKAVKLLNVSSRSESYDTLHQKAYEFVPCSSQYCTGSIVRNVSQTNRVNGTPRPTHEVLQHAKDFVDQYYSSIKRFNSSAHHKRWNQVLADVTTKGTYHLTETELVYGAKLAWRNSARCIGRIQWSKLQVFDARFVTTPGGMFEALCNHIKYATNKGNIRSAITIFPQRTDGKHDYRIWNSQLISYAGYKKPNGEIIGDPASVEFTDICIKLGWKNNGGSWDILPLVLSANGHDPEYFDLPKELVLQVPIHHPKFAWLQQFNLQWYSVPAVSSMLFDVGGLEFPSAPFNGWYMSTEIGCRNLGDAYRYNVLEKIAVKMDLDTRSMSSLWKDKAMIELNIAVLYSFQNANVTIVDHHTATDSFVKHTENEQRLRGGCPADWVWIVPPLSGSATPVFHQEMLLYHLKPSFEYQDVAWKFHVWKKDKHNSIERRRSTRKFRFKQIARAVKFTSKLFGKALSRRIKATILYATETGKSENYAKTLSTIFSHAFNTQVSSMSEYDIINLEHEALVLVVTSTFGNGDPPENGEQFAHNLYAMKMNDNPSSEKMSNQSKSFIKMNSQSESPKNITEIPRQLSFEHASSLTDFDPLGNLRFAVFGLGSSAYPNFCAFGKYVDHLLGELGGERLLPLRIGDELSGQEQTFRLWAKQVFEVACEVFCVGDDVSLHDVAAALQSESSLLSLGKVRLVQTDSDADVQKGLSKLLNKPISESKLLSRDYIPFDGNSEQQTILIKLSADTTHELSFAPGDHLAVCPVNRPELVDGIISRLTNSPPEDKTVELQILNEQQTPNGVIKTWTAHDRFPPCTIRTALERYLDITTPPAPQTLKVFASLATNETESKNLTHLANDAAAYEDWKFTRYPNLLEILETYPSISVEATVLLTLLSPLQPRFYSISSSPLAWPNQIHLTLGLLVYEVQGNSSNKHYGVCSGFLNSIPENSTVYCFIRTAPNFHLTKNFFLPIVMVGPGTGIAPFRSFWQEKEFLAKDEDGATTLWPMTLYFGCRNSNTDLYKTETSLLKSIGILQQIHTAYSRVHGQPKIYVQHLMCESSYDIFDQIYVRKGHFYVCGDVAMAEDVNQTLRSILASCGEMNMEQAERYVLMMRDENRYHEDIFGVTFRVAQLHSKTKEKCV